MVKLLADLLRMLERSEVDAVRAAVEMSHAHQVCAPLRYVLGHARRVFGMGDALTRHDCGCPPGAATPLDFGDFLPPLLSPGQHCQVAVWPQEC